MRLNLEGKTEEAQFPEKQKSIYFAHQIKLHSDVLQRAYPQLQGAEKWSVLTVIINVIL